MHEASNNPLHDRPAISGCDFFNLALDYEIRRGGLPGNICQLYLKVDGHLTAEQLRARLESSPLYAMLGRLRIASRIPPRGPRLYIQKKKSSIPVDEKKFGFDPSLNRLTQSPEDLAGITPWASGTPFRIDLEQGDDSTFVRLMWHHALMDSRGGELLLQFIGNPEMELSSHDLFPAQWLTPQPPLGERLKKNLLDSRVSHKTGMMLKKASKRVIASLSPDAKKCALLELQHRRINFTVEETAHIDDACEAAGAGFRRSLFFLAVTIRAVAQILENRGVEPRPFFIPVPLDTRKRGAAGPVLSNPVTFLFYRIEPAEITDTKSLVRTLVQRQKQQLSENQGVDFAQTMDFMRSLPLAVYTHLMRSPSQGKGPSFFFSDIGTSFPGDISFLGHQLLDAIHIPPIGFPPGFGVVFDRIADRQGIVLSFLDECLSKAEFQYLESVYREELLGEPPPVEVNGSSVAAPRGALTGSRV